MYGDSTSSITVQSASALYLKFHADSVAPAVQVRVAVFAVYDATVKAVGAKQVGCSSTVILSIYTPLFVLLEVAASIIMAI